MLRKFIHKSLTIQQSVSLDWGVAVFWAGPGLIAWSGGRRRVLHSVSGKRSQSLGKIVINRLKHSFWKDIILYNMIRSMVFTRYQSGWLDRVTVCSGMMIWSWYENWHKVACRRAGTADHQLPWQPQVSCGGATTGQRPLLEPETRVEKSSSLIP